MPFLVVFVIKLAWIIRHGSIYRVRFIQFFFLLSFVSSHYMYHYVAHTVRNEAKHDSTMNDEKGQRMFSLFTESTIFERWYANEFSLVDLHWDIVWFWFRYLAIAIRVFRVRTDCFRLTVNLHSISISNLMQHKLSHKYLFNFVLSSQLICCD